jgi:hypothetical protein
MKIILILLNFFSLVYAQDKVKLESRVTKQTQESGSASSFTPLDNTFRFKIDPKEVKDLRDADINSLVNQINILKSTVFDYKSKIIEAKRGLRGVIEVPLANLQITFNNRMSNRYRMINISCLLDGKNVYSNYDLREQKIDKINLYNSMIAPGYHEVVIQVVYVGNADGVFDYLNNYRVKVKSRHSFSIEDGVSYILDADGFEKGTLFTSFKDKPDIRFISRVENYSAINIGE